VKSDEMIKNLIGGISTRRRGFLFVFGFGNAMGLFAKPHVWASKIEFDDRL